MRKRRIFTIGAVAGAVAGLFPGTDASAASDAEARRVFKENCALCHGTDGRARVPVARTLGVKDLTLSKISDAEIEKQVTSGSKGPDGRDKMPAFGTKLSRQQIQALVRLVKSLRK
jgi:mono/diheme cytochrome c family protein